MTIPIPSALTLGRLVDLLLSDIEGLQRKEASGYQLTRVDLDRVAGQAYSVQEELRRHTAALAAHRCTEQ